MKFKTKPNDLLDQVLEILWTCRQGLGQRVQFYGDCQDFYLKGGPGGTSARANKIKPVINRQSAFLYAPESIKFWVDAAAEEDSESTYKRTDGVAQAISMAWKDTKLDTKFGRAVKYSRVNGCSIVAMLPRLRTDRKVDIATYYVHPRYFGVYRPDVPELEDQQAVTLMSYFTMDEIEQRLSMHPEKKKVMEGLSTASKDAPVGEEVIEGISPGATQFSSTYYKRDTGQYNAQQTVPYYGFTDIYAFDDALGDWRVFTVTGNCIVWDRPIERIGVPGMLPFVKVCAEEHPEYFWGISLVDDLKKLQNWYGDRMEDMDNLIQQILDPPTAAMGLGQSFEEKLAAFRKPGGRISSPNATGSIQQFVPTMPTEVFEFIEGIDSLLMDSSNMRPSMFGKQEPGTRTEGMAASMLRVAGAEMRLMGLEIETQAQACAQILFRYLRRYSAEKIVDEDGNLFRLAEFPDDVRVRVDGHSSNPLFVEDNAQLAMGLMRSGAITQETFVRLLQPTLEGKILHDLKKIQFAKLVAAEKVKIEQEMKRSGKATAGVS
jgi:hypothetical protein